PRKSHSTREIREQHAEVQKKYRCDRQRRYTDPVDFEGILKILGDCTWWHIWVYILISVQQIPHAMFSSSVVFLMYQPDYWCKINDSNMAKSAYKWSLKDVLETSVVFPLIKINHKNESLLHDQLHQMDLSQAIIAVRNESTDIAYCQRWEYDKSIMRSTIVTDWNLVCSDHFKEAYVHLLCSLGFFSGCLLGGYVSDRFGRRITIVGFGILSAIFGFFLPYSTRFSLFLLFRFLNAACNEAAQLAAYVLCIEVTGIRYRAAFGSMLQAPWVLGCLFVTLTAYISRSWRKVQLVTALLHVIAVLLLCALPESPRWLVISNRVEEAEHYIRQACRYECRPSLPCDLELVKHTEQQRWVKKNRQANVFSILKSRVLCFRAAVLSTIWISTALIYFVLFDQAGLGKFSISSNFFINNAIVAASEISAMFGCMYLFRFGHKNSQIIALIGAVTFMYATIGATHHNLLFIRGSFNVLYIFSLELYPTVIRSSAIGINLMVRLMKWFESIRHFLIPLTALFVFSVFATVLGIFLPESLDRPLPDTLQVRLRITLFCAIYNSFLGEVDLF
uniref:MFS domain-containing protein n=1 Tax=Syphacia muris TaxID=451379 RepID=A0A0N5AXT5_9BILA